MTLSGDLKTVLFGDVADDAVTRAAYSRDASIFELIPDVVVFPRDVHDVKKVVSYAAGHPGVSIVARGGGTDMSGGAIGTSVVMDMTRYMDGIMNIVRDGGVPGQDGYAVAQPGAWYRDFEEATLTRGLIMPAYPGSRDECALGGMVANNAGGERSLKYRQTVDFVRSVRAVMSDGNEYEFGPLTREQLDAKTAQTDFEGRLYRSVWQIITDRQQLIADHRPRVSKNSSGYYLWDVWNGATFNMARLLCGSQGTLGVLTQVTLGLVRPSTHRKMVIAFLRDLAPLADAVNDLLELKPETLESFDDKTISFTLRFLGDFVRLMGASGLLSLAWQFRPEFWMALRGGLPRLVLITEFAGDDATELDRKADVAVTALKKRGIQARPARDEREAQKYWTIRRSSFQVIRSHATGRRSTPFIDDFIVPPAVMPEFLPKLGAILAPYKLTLTIAGHAGDGNFHIIPLMDLRDEKTRRIIPELSEKVYDLVLQYGGSITAEHNDGLIRGPYVRRQFGPEMYALFRRVKKIFDPQNIFNPGKKIDVDWYWAMAHIRKD